MRSHYVLLKMSRVVAEVYAENILSTVFGIPEALPEVRDVAPVGGCATPF